MRNEEIGLRIKSRRKELQISAVDLAAQTGLSKATIHRYESGDIKDIKLPTIEKMAKILSVNEMWLIGKSDIKERTSPNQELLALVDDAINILEEVRNRIGG